MVCCRVGDTTRRCLVFAYKTFEHERLIICAMQVRYGCKNLHNGVDGLTLSPVLG